MNASIVLCDASPLIFLAKVDLLDLLFDVPGGSLTVLECVIQEVLSQETRESESERLAHFFSRVHGESFQVTPPSGGALSRSDIFSLTWARRHGVEWMIVDERLLRRAALAEGIKVTGFLGVVLEAAARKLISCTQARHALDSAVRDHGFRIGIQLYQRVLVELERLA